MGGHAGHMTHIFEDMDLTFGELKDIIKQTMKGNIEITEKTDGMALAVTWKDGKLKGARNKATIKEPLDIQQMSDKFAGRGEIQKAFTNSMKDLQDAIGSLSNPVDFFGDGYKYLSIEIIYPPTKNVIDYGSRAIIQFHDITTFDHDANKGEVNQAEAQKLFKTLSKNNALKQNTFEIVGAQKLKPDDLSGKSAIYLRKLKKVQGRIKDKVTIGQYYDQQWLYQINRSFPKLNPDMLPYFVLRYSRYKKTLNKGAIKKRDPYAYNAMTTLDNIHTELYKQIRKPLESIIMGMGTEILAHATGFISANPSNTVKLMTNELNKIKKEFDKGNIDDKLRDKITYHLDAINAIGVDKLAPSEGLVFKYKGRVYKMTGLFASFNQILGVFKYGR